MLAAIGAFAVLAVLLAGALAPSVWGTFAGYQLQALKQERQRLIDERSTLEVEEAVAAQPRRAWKSWRGHRNYWSRLPARWSIWIRTPDGSLALNLT